MRITGKEGSFFWSRNLKTRKIPVDERIDNIRYIINRAKKTGHLS
jgi:hypothetical protein